MNKIFLILTITFILIGCGGSALDNIENNINSKNILTKNSWYEACEDNSSNIYKFFNDHYTKYSYKDENFTNISSENSHKILEYTEAGFSLEDKICAVSNVVELDNNKTVNIDSILVECVPTKSNSTRFQLFIAWKNKNLAKDNKTKCF